MRVKDLIFSYKGNLSLIEIEYRGEPIYFKSRNIDKKFLDMFVDDYSVDINQNVIDIYIKVVDDDLLYSYLFNLEVMTKYLYNKTKQRDISNNKATFIMTAIIDNAIRRNIDVNVVEEITGVRIFKSKYKGYYIYDIMADVYDDYALFDGKIYYKDINDNYEYINKVTYEHYYLLKSYLKDNGDTI